MDEWRSEYARSHPRQSCFQKKAYGEQGARQSAARINQRTGTTAARAYACTHCGQYHIGRAPGVTIAPDERRSHGPRPDKWRHRGRGVG